jgi:tRNA (guanine-N7-)-methyltransferase
VDLELHSTNTVAREISEKLNKFEKIYLNPVAGSGSSDIELAKKFKKVAFLLIEKKFKRAFKAASKVEKFGLTNVLVVRGKFEQFLDIVRGFTCDCINLLFPDPWPKERWKENRLYAYSTLRDMISILKPRGNLLVKTDSWLIFAEILVSSASALKNNSYRLPYKEPIKVLRSDFEKKFLAKKQSIGFFVVKNTTPFSTSF